MQACNNSATLRAQWMEEERAAHIHGWDFSHIEHRCAQGDLPWSYEAIVRQTLRPDMRLLDYDTGGGEFLRSLHHPFEHTAATEGFPPNVSLCRERLMPLGIDFRECADPAHIPFENGRFDIVLNRHGSYEPTELYRLLKAGGMVITQQVGAQNDRALVQMVLPELPMPFPHLTLARQQPCFEAAGFEILRAEEAFCPIRFFDIGAFVWFARIIEWEFIGFSVEKCFTRLLELQQVVEQRGFIEGSIHRFLIVARKPSGNAAQSK